MYLPRDLISHLYTNLVRSHHAHSPAVLLLVALEPDSLCACRIITALLRRDFVQHKIQPVSGYADLAKAGETLVRPMKTTEGGSGGLVICLGVGGLVDLGAVLGLEDEDLNETMCGVEVWVLDARRPYNLDNVFGGIPIEAPLEDVVNGSRPRARGVEKGCLQKSYRSGKGGIIVFDDGDIASDLNTERDAYCALAEMPEVDDEADDEDDQDDDGRDTERSSQSKKRKSWTDRDDENEDTEDDDERPRQRRRSNSGSSIATSRSRSRSKTPSSSQPTSPSSKPQSPKQQTAKQLRQRLRRLREEHESVLRQYNSLGTSYSEPVSTLAYSLATDLGREDNDILWLAIIGVTSLELSGHTSTGLGTSVSRSTALTTQQHRGWRMTRSSQTYALLRDEVRRLNPPPADQSPMISPTTGTSSPSDTTIRLTPDPRFLLLRHWSLYDSMLHSSYLAARLHVWNESGTKRLHKLLAKMGVSLTQCKQTYTHMDMELKKTLRDRLLKYAGVYGLDDLVPSGTGRASYEQEGWGFIRSWGWKAQLSAVDVGVILGAILDVGPTSTSSGSSNTASYTQSQSQASKLSTKEDVPDRSTLLLPRFFAAYDALNPTSPSKLLDAISSAQHLLRSILRTGSSLLQKHQIRHLRAFRMGVVKEGPDLPLFAGSPGALVKLALWVGEAIAVQEREKSGGWDGSLPTPLVLAALDEERGTYVVVGTGGGIGGGEDIEGRKEREQKRKRREEEREKKKKVREEKRAARKAQRELLGEESDAEDEDTESESEPESESEDDEVDEAELEKRRKRGYGHNRFGIAFQEVVEETNARVRIDSFDHCIVEVKKEDLAGFLEGLSLKAVVGR
ncbi:cell division control protein 45 [Cladophialophora yegresii CBS 114405]|uniref:Cell division control protein 45 n=1 Tax=Cladophialophora yegresii CBS 114405 TaxID=1182544 RepID=W9VZ25_9EURO|nr:cell division control protein 45 [Cladophialophora yegresii CBS 114405]EXJ57506.1 cell division control protein 45 [Cladophialophora yegresii CBS 114405]